MEIEKSGLYFKNLTKKFGTIVAVDDISLHVEEGEFLTLLGPSGSGKTTTLMCRFRTAHIVTLNQPAKRAQENKDK